MFGERGRWIMVALGVSILINLFLAGMVAGRLTMPGWHGSPPNGGAILGLFPRAQIKELPFSEKQAFWAAMRSHAAEVRAAHARVMEVRREVVAAIGAPVFNRAALDAKLEVLHRATLEQQIAGEKAAVDALAVLSAQSRAAIARDATERMDEQASAAPPPKDVAATNEPAEQPKPVVTPPAQAAVPESPHAVPSPSKPVPETPTPAKPSPEMRAAMKGMREACATDIATLCKGVEPGGGRIAKCLKDHRDDLSAGCKSAWRNLRAEKQSEER